MWTSFLDHIEDGAFQRHRCDVSAVTSYPFNLIPGRAAKRLLQARDRRFQILIGISDFRFQRVQALAFSVSIETRCEPREIAAQR